MTLIIKLINIRGGNKLLGGGLYSLNAFLVVLGFLVCLSVLCKCTNNIWTKSLNKLCGQMFNLPFLIVVQLVLLLGVNCRCYVTCIF